MSSIRVLIVDDSVFMRTMLRDMLRKDPAIEIVGTATNGLDALKKMDELSPDVITLDVEMPGMNGLEALRRIVVRPDRPKIMMLSSLTSKDAETTRTALRIGADDFMLKPKGINTVRGIEKELNTKIHHLIEIPGRSTKKVASQDIADRAVLIGSSAGGPPMLDLLISMLEPLPAAVVIIQHMPLGFTAPLSERLNRIAQMPVKETDTGDILVKGRIFVSRAGYHTVITGIMTPQGERGGKIIHSSSPPLHSVRPAVDRTFVSAAKVFGRMTVSAILSGMGNDGGEGTAEIKKAGGVTLVCREEDCLVYGMARSALGTQRVDHIVPLRRMADEISTIVSGLGDGNV